ncbi:unnamed protein product, partial [Mesorhabditis belari]|uniref:RING-type domain-containing protein n=1 Tax=Mesorhabditis belari TaxID=2138241 RepID=A0AAF3FMS6_9BILA
MNPGELDRLPMPGVFQSINAFTIAEDGRTAYFHDPQPDVVYSVDLRNGIRKALKWEDHDFKHRRWLCYTLFNFKYSNEVYLSMLFYNKHKKVFCLIHFLIAGELLIKRQTSMLNTSAITHDRLAYSVQKCSNEIQMIFYERFSRAHSIDGDENQNPLHFVCCILDTTTMRVTTKQGMLPMGQWELPFITNRKLHVLCTTRSPNILASRSLESTETLWDARAINPSLNDLTPAKKAQWCNAWTTEAGYFALLEKIVSQEEPEVQTIRRVFLWHLDPSTASWTKLPCQQDLPDCASNISFRIGLDGMGYVHCDLQPREACILKVKLDQALTNANRVAAEAAAEDWLPLESHSTENGQNSSNFREPLSDLICPICLDTYDDARTLSCGHSLCWACVEQMRLVAKSETVACPACRKLTKIPAGGLPVNYGLKDAILTLSRLVEVRNRGIRCGECREKCEETKMWTCLTCLRHGSTKLNRESMVYVGNLNASSFEEDPNDSNAESLQKEMSQQERFGRFSFCASCLLYYHKGHDYEEVLKLRERSKLVDEMKGKWLEKANSSIQTIKETTTTITNGLFDEEFLERCSTAISSNPPSFHGSPQNLSPLEPPRGFSSRRSSTDRNFTPQSSSPTPRYEKETEVSIPSLAPSLPTPTSLGSHSSPLLPPLPSTLPPLEKLKLESEPIIRRPTVLSSLRDRPTSLQASPLSSPLQPRTVVTVYTLLRW